MDLADEYPIIPFFLIILNVLSAIPVILLIIIANKSQIHGNCRFLVSAWAAGFLFLFACNINVAHINLQLTDGYLTKSMFEPVERNISCQIIVALSFFCSVLEVAIAIERIVSSWIEPHIYHDRGFSLPKLLILMLIITLLSAFVGYFAHGMRYVKLGGVILSAVDGSTILINLYAVSFCRRQYEKLFGRASLNARYQVREAYEMAQAMKPVYVCSLLTVGKGL
ncbi:hypothetical protein PFISCL1PPCAC_2940 [Pristionchus fissidentatus]|uniref:G protein-coupled receptor n=1 Tax=Pristionchus fissidentatus TaxID=1538716 RepID=A0AAV5UY25_9BILA|nr:hypothetical protein PFISCL1PPCAC_2940 [Pristionchus fissidentatus]